MSFLFLAIAKLYAVLCLLFCSVLYRISYCLWCSVILYCSELRRSVVPDHVLRRLVLNSLVLHFMVLSIFPVSHFLHLRLVWRFGLYFSVPERLANP